MKDEIYLETTQQIYEEFEHIKQTLISDEDFLFDELTEKLQETKLVFGDYHNKLTIAVAFFDNNTVMFTKNNLNSKRRTIIHELAHQLTYFSNSQGDSGAHCLEFAIINYVLQRKYAEVMHDYRHCYFNSYDIHEDKCYSSIQVNISQFDNMVRTIKYSNLSELCETAKRLAQKIRRKSTQ